MVADGNGIEDQEIHQNNLDTSTIKEALANRQPFELSRLLQEKPFTCITTPNVDRTLPDYLKANIQALKDAGVGSVGIGFPSRLDNYLKERYLSTPENERVKLVSEELKQYLPEDAAYVQLADALESAGIKVIILDTRVYKGTTTDIIRAGVDDHGQKKVLLIEPFIEPLTEPFARRSSFIDRFVEQYSHTRNDVSLRLDILNIRSIGREIDEDSNFQRTPEAKLHIASHKEGLGDNAFLIRIHPDTTEGLQNAFPRVNGLLHLPHKPITPANKP